ncbi:MAG: adenylyltransferase/cytidyltransferase family protein [Candidatus Taylorbacteria bacterium]
MESNVKKVLAFGVFDTFHEGHRAFLTQAKELGNTLTVVVARDDMVKLLKNKTPVQTLQQRKEAVKKEKIADEVISSEDSPGEWKIIGEIRPDVIALGYDQDELLKSIKAIASEFPFTFEIIKLNPYRSGTFHSSLL